MERKIFQPTWNQRNRTPKRVPMPTRCVPIGQGCSPTGPAYSPDMLSSPPVCGMGTNTTSKMIKHLGAKDGCLTMSI